jgi:hypothetical protein
MWQITTKYYLFENLIHHGEEAWGDKFDSSNHNGKEYVCLCLWVLLNKIRDNITQVTSCRRLQEFSCRRRHDDNHILPAPIIDSFDSKKEKQKA